MKMKGAFNYPVVLFIVLLSLLVWMYPPEAYSQPQTGGTFRLIRYSGPGRSLGWPPSIGRTDQTDATPSLDSLLYFYLDLHIEPVLATSWQIAPDRSSITFSLRKGVRFHDGTDWNAEAAKFNLDAYKAAKRPGTRYWTEIKVMDDYTIQVVLNGWENTILEDIGSVLMISPTAYKTMGKDKVNWHPVGTGPFKFVSLERDVITKYERNKDYWQKGKPYVDRIELLVIKDPVTQGAAMEAGEADALYSPNLKVSGDLRNSGFENLYRHDGHLMLVPDSANPDSPYSDKRVREAVEYAIDKVAILKTLGQGFWEPAYQLACSFNKGFIPNMKRREYDLNKAKSLLKDAGYSDGFKTKFMVFPGTSREIMSAVQGYLAQVGIKVELEYPDMGRYMQVRRSGWHNGIMVAPWSGYPNMGRTLGIYVATSGKDYVKNKRPAGMDKLVEEAINAPEIDESKLKQIVQLFYDEVMCIPLGYVGAPRTLRKGVVHDTGFLEFANNYEWAPENVWLSK